MSLSLEREFYSAVNSGFDSVVRDYQNEVHDHMADFDLTSEDFEEELGQSPEEWIEQEVSGLMAGILYRLAKMYDDGNGLVP